MVVVIDSVAKLTEFSGLHVAALCRVVMEAAAKIGGLVGS